MLIQLIIILLCYKTIADPVYYDVDDMEAVNRLFEKFIEEHKRTYVGPEKFQRLRYFSESLRRINALNKEFGGTFGINKFSDMSMEESAPYLSGLRAVDDILNGDCTVYGDPMTKDAPDAFDWRDKKAVSPVKDQHVCGSCWAFSAAALVESRCLMKGHSINVSEQQLVDCDRNSGGCNGGLPTFALSNIMDYGGEESEADYPYEARNGKCRFDENKITVKVSNCSAYVLTSEDMLKELLFKEGPLSIGIAASNDLVHYTGGIFKKCDAPDINHAVLLVGYGSEDGVDFWVIKNSWSEHWGEKGFIRLKRGVNCTQIASPLSITKVSAVVSSCQKSEELYLGHRS